MPSTNINAVSKLLRLDDIISPHGPLPVSRSTWFEWVKDGRVPQPIKLGPRVTAYRMTEIEAFIANPENWLAAADVASSSQTLRNAKLEVGQ